METLNEQFFVDNGKHNTFSVNDILQSGEKVLWQQSPKKRTFALKSCIKFLPIAISWAIIDIFILYTIITTMQDQSFLFFIIPFFALHLAPVWICIGSAVKGYAQVKYIKYIITNKRIIVIDGKEMFVSNDIKLKELTSCKVSQNFVGKLSGVCDIIIQSDKNIIVFNDIKNAKYICKKINEIITKIGQNSKDTITCEYCGSVFESSKNKCPFCGATKKLWVFSKKNVQDVEQND